VDFLLELAWKNAVVAGALALAASAAGRLLRRPALAHGLWLLVLVKLVTPPLWQLAVPWPLATPASPAAPASTFVSLPPGELEAMHATAAVEAPAALISLATTSSTAQPRALPAESTPALESTLEAMSSESYTASGVAPVEARPGFTLTWPETLICVWALGSSAWLGLLFARLRRFRRLARFATPASSLESCRVAELAASIGLKRTPALRFLPARVPPMTWSFGGGLCLLVPRDLWLSLSIPQRDTLILHELAHLRRGDHWIRHLELLVLVFHWWNPLSWWAQYELQEAEEECCDAWVIRTLPHCAADYADLIVETVAYLSARRSPALPPLASGLGQIQQVRKRLAIILRGSAAPRLSLSCWLILAIVASLLLPVIPTSAREPWALFAGYEYSLDLGDNTAARATGRKLLLTESASSLLPGDALSQALNAADLVSPFEENLAILRLQLIQRQAELVEEQLRLERASKAAQRGLALASRGNGGLALLEPFLVEQRIHEAQVRSHQVAVEEMQLLVKQEESRVHRFKQAMASASTESADGVPPVSAAAVAVTGNTTTTLVIDARIDRMERRLDDLVTQAKALEAELKAEAARETNPSGPEPQVK
jgi:beta-lactamase regulating signal transducer with metallopeptidase domain